MSEGTTESKQVPLEEQIIVSGMNYLRIPRELKKKYLIDADKTPNPNVFEEVSKMKVRIVYEWDRVTVER